MLHLALHLTASRYVLLRFTNLAQSTVKCATLKGTLDKVLKVLKIVSYFGYTKNNSLEARILKLFCVPVRWEKVTEINTIGTSKL